MPVVILLSFQSSAYDTFPVVANYPCLQTVDFVDKKDKVSTFTFEVFWGNFTPYWLQESATDATNSFGSVLGSRTDPTCEVSDTQILRKNCTSQSVQ